MSQRLPASAYVLGLAGVIPFAACGIATLSAAGHPAFALPALIAYGASILSFVGAVHWGLALAPQPVPTGPIPAVGTRLALGVLPSLIGWGALLLTVADLPEVALAALIVGFIATVTTESRWAKLGLLPNGYMALRWILSVLVVMVLGTVLTLRLLGASIVF
jgi:hypothetical protein